MCEGNPIHEEYVDLVTETGMHVPAVFLWNEDKPDCVLTLRYADIELVRTDTDYFDA